MLGQSYASGPSVGARWGALVALLVLQSLALTLHKRVSERMGPYPSVLTLAQPMCTSTCFGLLASLGSCKLCEWQGKGRTRDASRRSLLQYASIGVGYTLNNLLLFTGSRSDLVAGGLVVLLRQAVVPVVLVLSIVFLRHRFRTLQWVGAAAVVGGITLSLWPKLTGGAQSHVGSAVLVLLSTLPLGAATTYMEVVLQRTRGPGGGDDDGDDARRSKEPEIFWMWMWINVAEALVALPLLFLMVPLQDIPLGDSSAHIRDGFRCLVLGEGAAGCDGVLGLFVAFVLVLVLAKGALGVLVLTEGAALSWLAATCALPLSEMWFALGVGGPSAHMSGYTWVALPIVTIGLALFKAQRRARGGEREGEAEPEERSALAAGPGGPWTDDTVQGMGQRGAYDPYR